MGFVAFALTGLAALGSGVAVAEGREAAGGLGAESPVAGEVPVAETVPPEVPVVDETPPEVPGVEETPPEGAGWGEVLVWVEDEADWPALGVAAGPEPGEVDVGGPEGTPFAATGGLGLWVRVPVEGFAYVGEGESLPTAAQAVVEAAATTAAPAAIAVQRRLPGESLPSLGDDLWEC